MSTAVLFNLPGASGHINPTVGLVSGLINRGERVIYYAGEDSRRQFEALGATFRTYAPFFEYQHSAAMATALLDGAFMMLGQAENALAGLIRVMEQDKPDYILYDSCCLFGKYVAQRLGVPGICLVTTIVSTPLLLTSDLPLAWQVVKELTFGVPRVFEAVRRIKDLLASVGLKYRGLPYHMFDVFANEGDLNIVFLSPSAQPFHRFLKKNYLLVGPSIPEGRDPPADLPIGLGSSLPVIYVSLGTVHNLKQDFYRQCFKAFAELPCHVVMSVGKDTDIAALGSIPVNFTVRNRVPQLEVLKRTRVFVSHGGMNSINESLYFGVPLVMVPQQVEQGFNARRVEKLGAGRLLKSEKITVDSLRETVSQVLQDERYRQNAAQLGQQMQGLGGYARAVDEILCFVQGDAQPALRKTA